MGRIVGWTEQIQRFKQEMKENLWKDLHQETRLAWEGFFEEQSRKEMDRDLGVQD